MKITYELDLNKFEFWQGAKDTFEIIYNANKVEDLEYLLEELYPNGMEETELNDLLWFEDEWLFESLGIEEEEEEEEEE